MAKAKPKKPTTGSQAGNTETDLLPDNGDDLNPRQLRALAIRDANKAFEKFASEFGAAISN